MELIGQENHEKDDKIKKIVVIALIISVIALVIVVGLIIYLAYADSQTLKLYVDKVKTPISTDLLKFEETSPDKMYFSIEDIAKIVGYDYYHGDFKRKNEDQDKCYLDNKKEVAGFELGSNQLYKVDPTVTNQDYEWFKMNEPVRLINGKMYVTSKAIETACNVSITYNQDKNRIEILTLPYLAEQYESIAINNYGYSGLDSNFNNQKTILKGMLVIKKQEGKDKFKYGVVSAQDNKQIIGVKYDKIEYIEIANDFYVTSDKKMGISSGENGATKIKLEYDTIKVLDNDLRLYYVKNGNAYGVLNRNGDRVVYLEYNQIGVDTSLFPSNEIKNSMLLFDNCIPVMKNNKWGVFDKNGNVLAETVYDSLGFLRGTSKDSNINNLLVIPSIEGIVICKDGKYGIMNSTGKFLSPIVFDKIYSITNLGEDKYYLEYNGQTYTLEEYLKLSNQSSSTNDTQTGTTGNNSTSNEVDTNTIGSNTIDANTINSNNVDTNTTTDPTVTVPDFMQEVPVQQVQQVPQDLVIMQ